MQCGIDFLGTFLYRSPPEIHLFALKYVFTLLIPPLWNLPKLHCALLTMRKFN